MILKLNNWRCFQETRITLPNQSLILCDQNGSGKTSILSAVYGLFTGNPWPLTKMSSSLMAGKEYFGIGTESHVDSWFLNGKISPSGRLITKYEKPEHPTLEMFQGSTTSGSPLYQRGVRGDSPTTTPICLNDIKILTYLPNDNSWFFESRSGKLRILDELLGQIFGENYRRPLKILGQTNLQKTTLIKHSREHNKPIDKTLLKTLSQNIHENSVQIWQQRLNFFEYLNSNLPEFETWIASDLKNWQIKWEISDHFGQRTLVKDWKFCEKQPNWDNIWNKEINSEKVLYGAHRDDFNIISQHQNCQEIFSRGEMRTLVLFIKNIAQDLSPKLKTIWLIDDIFNELDQERENIIFNKILNKADWFIATSTHKIDTLTNTTHSTIKALTRQA